MENIVLNFFINLKNAIIDLVFPERCGLCGKINNEGLCQNCYKTFTNLEVNKIEKVEGVYFDKLLFIFRYKGIIRRLILRYKFNNCGYLYKLFSYIITNNTKCLEIFKLYDVIVPVPMSSDKKLKRGYNQTELIANEIKNKSNICIDTKSVIKYKSVKVQSLLSAEERKINVLGAFEVVNRKNIEGKKVIIFDDIYTTGATANEISKVLKEAGAKKIFILVLARD